MLRLQTDRQVAGKGEASEDIGHPDAAGARHGISCLLHAAMLQRSTGERSKTKPRLIAGASC